MTPVQSASIPLALQGKALVVKAKTGTGKRFFSCISCIKCTRFIPSYTLIIGKTLAFLIPAIDVSSYTRLLLTLRQNITLSQIYSLYIHVQNLIQERQRFSKTSRSSEREDGRPSSAKKPILLIMSPTRGMLTHTYKLCPRVLRVSYCI